MLASALCIDVIETFKKMHQALIELEQQVVEADPLGAAWFAPPTSLPCYQEQNTRQQIMTFVRQLEYLPDQNPREILVGAGLVAASKKTLTQIAKVNQCKANFKSAMLALKAAKISIQDPIIKDNMEGLLESRPEVIKDSLKKMGLARLHLKQCYRLIPSFEERPKKVSWTWAHTRSIKRITVADAEQMLRKQGVDSGIQIQLNKLAKLPPSEPLAIVQELAPHLRANILFENGQRKMVKGPVPIFYLDKEGLDLPEFIPPKEKTLRDESRVVRNDVKLDPVMFLPAIRAHRYKEEALA